MIFLIAFAAMLPFTTFWVLTQQRARRQSFTVGGAPASDDEREAALAALRSGRLPADPRVREATVSYARGQVDTRAVYWTMGIVFGLAALIGLVFGITYTPWSWLLCGLVAAVGPMVIVSVRRHGQRARRILMAVQDPAA